MPGVSDLVHLAWVHLVLDAWMVLMKGITIPLIQGTLSYRIPMQAQSHHHRIIGDQMVR